MKTYLSKILFLQFLLNGVMANLNGQTNERVPLLNADGNETGTTITCSPYSVEDETNEVEFVKYVLDTEEEDSSTVVWNSQPNITAFELCASYAAEQNAGMFYFDGATCETSDNVYERKEKTCDSIAAKMVYMQKGLEAAVSPECEDGYVSADETIPCGVTGRNRCENSMIITERKYSYGDDNYTPHMEGVDYFLIDEVCFLKPIGFSSLAMQGFDCDGYEAAPCDPPTGVESSTFIEYLKEFLDSSIVTSMSIPFVAINAHKNSTNLYNWRESTSFLFPFNASNSSEKCLALSTTPSHDPMEIDCDDYTGKLCCMLRENNMAIGL